MNKSDRIKLKELFSWTRLIIITIIIGSILYNFLISFNMVQGKSMMPTYNNNDIILLDRTDNLKNLLGLNKNHQRYDVIILQPDKNNNKRFFIKRIIGLPGETIIFKNGSVFIQNQNDKNTIKIKEDFLLPENISNTFVNIDHHLNTDKIYKYQIPEDSYFVLGDNRIVSEDSRNCFSECGKYSHFIKDNQIVGKPIVNFSK